MFDSDSSRERDLIGPLDAEAPTRPAVGEYVLAMNHELRAPLNAVIGMSGLLLGGELGERERQYARSVHAAGESLSTILNDLIDLSRVMAGRLPIEPIPFDLRSMVEETVKALGPRAADRGLTLRVDWRPELPRQVVGDPGRTRQVLGNLVGRALNATSQGEIAIQVAPDGEIEGRDCVRFSVEDTGIGLPESRLSHIFDEYTPIDASPYRSFGTTGLGLRVSAELVQLMGGEIGADSEIGKGSRFWFRLPLAAAEGAADLVLESPAPSTGGRALIVETDHASRRRFEDQLTLAGWDADFADDIAEVEERLRAAAGVGSPYRTCILSDYAVQPFHAELALRFKTDDQLSPVALVMATAVGSPGEGKRLWHAGFTAYLRKPIPNEEMSGTLVALDHVGPDGRSSALITRHSLAEARQAQSATAFDRIDEVLASLTASITRQVLVLGASGTDQIEITEALAQCDLKVEVPTELDHAIERLARHAYEMVIVDADHGTYRDRPTLEGIANQMRHLDPQPPFVAITVDPTMRDELLAAGVEHVLAKPIRRTELERIARRAAADTPETETEFAASEAIAAAGLVIVDQPDTETDANTDTDTDTDTDIDSGSAHATDAAEGAQTAETVVTGDRAPEAEPIVAEAGPAVADDAATNEMDDGSDTIAPVAGQAAAIDPTPILAVGAPVMADPDRPAIVEVEGTDTTALGALIESCRDNGAPAIERGRAETSSADINAGPLSGMVRLDPDETVDAEPLAGLIVNDLEMETDETAVIEPVELTDHALGPDAAESRPAPAGADHIDAVIDDPEHELLELVLDSPIDMTELSADPIEAEPAAETDLAPPVADDNEPAAAAVPVIGLDFGDSVDELVEEPADYDEELEVLGAISFDAPDVRIDGEADSEEIAFLAPTTSDVAIGPMRLVGPGDHLENSDDEPAAIKATVGSVAGREAENDPDLPVIGATILEQLGSQSGGFAQHLVATFLKDAPQRIGELATAVSRGSAEQLSVALRSLKATSGLLGAARLGALCSEMEASIEQGDLEGAAQHVGALEQAFLQVRMAVEAAAPPEAQAPAELPAIGATFVDQLSPDADEASRTLALKLVDTFRGEAPARLADLTDAIVREDAEAVERLAPALKGMCGLIGADPLSKLCALAQADARLRRIASARRYVDQLQLELTRVLDALGRAVD